MKKEYYEELLPYRLGGLLYTPALNETIADKIIKHTYERLNAIALCLEDAIMDDAVEQAEEALCRTLETLQQEPPESLPLVFVRIRTPEHFRHVHERLGNLEQVLTGYIFPKFDLSNAEEYCQILGELNAASPQKIYGMPILESGPLADCLTRRENLRVLKQILLTMQSYILNVRVGGNDLCQLYGLRRNASQTIYDIGVIRDILVDIINIFGSDFVISGPVWEYFGEDRDAPWAKGLQRELELDLINGFIGKTAVHPTQLPLIYESLQVSRSDYRDAQHILNWKFEKLGVSKGADDSRMNEVKCHTRWAKRIKILGDIYGFRETE